MRSIFIFLLLLLPLFLLSACSNAGEDANNDDTNVTPNPAPKENVNWNEIKWDQDNWV